MNAGRAGVEGNREQGAGNSRRTHGLALVAKRAESVAGDALVLPEEAAGRLVMMLPRVWAVADGGGASEVERRGQRSAVEQRPGSRPKVELAFYRKYTEAMLRRYLRMSTEAGRVPSLLGRELFRGNVTSYRVHSFEDVVVFCMDVERCLARLGPQQKELVRRVALQEYTQAEAAAVMGVGLRFVAREYGATVDRLTGMFLEAGMLEPLKSCQ